MQAAGLLKAQWVSHQKNSRMLEESVMIYHLNVLEFLWLRTAYKI